MKYFYTAVDNHLKQIKRYRLLSKEEEKVLGGQIQTWLSIERAMNEQKVKNNGKYSSLEIAAQFNLSVSQLPQKIKEGQEARQTLIKHNQGLVFKLALKYFQAGSKRVELLDLVQMGNFGLIKAVEKFDPKRGLAFSTMAYYWIARDIENELNQNSYLIRIPFHVQEYVRKIRKAYRILSEQNQSKNLENLVHLTGLKANVVELSLQIMSRRLLSLEQPLSTSRGPEDSSPLLDFISDNEKQEADCPEIKENQDLVTYLLKQLTDKERFILVNYVVGDKSFKEIGQLLGYSHENVRRIHKKTLLKLQSMEI